MQSTFLNQFETLKKTLPLPDFHGSDVENSDYGDYLFSCKNVYYAFDVAECQNSLYIYDSIKLEGCIDCTETSESQYCYECVDCHECYNCTYMVYSDYCYDCNFCVSCKNCHDCFGCVELEHKKYCIFNKEYSKEEYFSKLKELKRKRPSEIFEKIKEIEKSLPKYANHHFQNENSDYTDYAYFCGNSYYCFDVSDIEDSGYLFSSNFCRNCWDGTYLFQCEQCYESNDSSECYNSSFIDYCARCYDSAYLYNCLDCHNCFGCAGLMHKSFCILNKQYSEEEYKIKINEIKKELYWQSV